MEHSTSSMHLRRAAAADTELFKNATRQAPNRATPEMHESQSTLLAHLLINPVSHNSPRTMLTSAQKAVYIGVRGPFLSLSLHTSLLTI